MLRLLRVVKGVGVVAVVKVKVVEVVEVVKVQGRGQSLGTGQRLSFQTRLHDLSIAWQLNIQTKINRYKACVIQDKLRRQLLPFQTILHHISFAWQLNVMSMSINRSTLVDTYM